MRSESAIERAEAHEIDIAELRAMLQRTPTERLEVLQARTTHGESAIDRAEAYGIDVSLLKLALTWTPTQRVQKLQELINTLQAMRQAGEKRYGP
ncbi:MAG: hypothetical protein ACE5HA_04620 [Anaerolineae bacterium]